MPYRALEGGSVIYRSRGLTTPVPDYATICRRQRKLTVKVPIFKPGEHTCILADSTGLKVAGHGESGVTTIGDGAYDSKRCYRATHAAGGKHIAPPKTGAVRWDNNVPAFKQRNRHIDNVHMVGLAEWKKWINYHRRSAVESAMHRLKWITGERALSRKLANLKTEVILRAKLLNSIITSAIC